MIWEKMDQSFSLQFLEKNVQRVLIEALSGHMDVKKVAGKSQHRFTKDKLCPIVLYYETIWSMKDGSSSLDIICLNFSKLFGMVSHNILVDNLVRHGLGKGHKMHGELAGLLSSKLLVANGSESNLQLAMCGVPQGSTLALILFNIFINNLDERLECICAKLADDARLGREVECKKERPPYRDIDRVRGWTDKVLTEINVKFCTWYGIIPSSNTGWALTD